MYYRSITNHRPLNYLTTTLLRKPATLLIILVKSSAKASSALVLQKAVWIELHRKLQGERANLYLPKSVLFTRQYIHYNRQSMQRWGSYYMYTFSITTHRI